MTSVNTTMENCMELAIKYVNIVNIAATKDFSSKGLNGAMDLLKINKAATLDNSTITIKKAMESRNL
jgi:hypothetical protein